MQDIVALSGGYEKRLFTCQTCECIDRNSYRLWNVKAAKAAIVCLHARRRPGLKVEPTAMNYWRSHILPMYSFHARLEEQPSRVYVLKEEKNYLQKVLFFSPVFEASCWSWSCVQWSEKTCLHTTSQREERTDFSFLGFSLVDFADILFLMSFFAVLQSTSSTSPISRSHWYYYMCYTCGVL